MPTFYSLLAITLRITKPPDATTLMVTFSQQSAIGYLLQAYQSGKGYQVKAGVGREHEHPKTVFFIQASTGPSGER